MTQTPACEGDSTGLGEGAAYLYAVRYPVMVILKFCPSCTSIIWEDGSNRNSFIMGLK